MQKVPPDLLHAAEPLVTAVLEGVDAHPAVGEAVLVAAVLAAVRFDLVDVAPEVAA